MIDLTRMIKIYIFKEITLKVHFRSCEKSNRIVIALALYFWELASSYQYNRMRI